MSIDLRRSLEWVLGLARQAYEFVRKRFKPRIDLSGKGGEKTKPAPKPRPKVHRDPDELQPDYGKPELKRILRQASIELFSWLGLTHVPGPFWPLVEKHRDPIGALEEFVRGIGCDFQKVRSRDKGEIERFQEVIDLLEIAGPLIDTLDKLQPSWFQDQILQKNYEKTRRLAKHIADLEELLTTTAHYKTDPTLHVFKSFVDEVQSLAAKPFEVTEEDVRAAKEHAAAYTWRIDEFRRCNSEYQFAIGTIGHWFRQEWRGTSREAEIRNLAGGGNKCIEELAGLDFSFDAVDERLATLRYCAEGLLAYKLESETAPSGGGSGPKGRKSPESELSRALKFFGFTEDRKPDCNELKSAWRKIVTQSHPDKNKSAGAEERTKMANANYTFLRGRLRCS
jgi:hypothetical protein